MRLLAWLLFPQPACKVLAKVWRLVTLHLLPVHQWDLCVIRVKAISRTRHREGFRRFQHSTSLHCPNPLYRLHPRAAFRTQT